LGELSDAFFTSHTQANKGVFVMEDTAEPINKPNKQHKYPANQPYNPNNDSIYPEDDRCIEQFGNNDKGKVPKRSS
jgi:hypothetical protein